MNLRRLRPGALGFAIGALGLLVGSVHASAQRAPVLQQIKVRHPYYYREMFIPQVTSGPSAAAWSPDGTELVYSMQGSLWRQRVPPRAPPVPAVSAVNTLAAIAYGPTASRP